MVVVPYLGLRFIYRFLHCMTIFELYTLDNLMQRHYSMRHQTPHENFRNLRHLDFEPSNATICPTRRHEESFIPPQAAQVHHSFSMNFPHRWQTHPNGLLFTTVSSDERALAALPGGFGARLLVAGEATR